MILRILTVVALTVTGTVMLPASAEAGRWRGKAKVKVRRNRGFRWNKRKFKFKARRNYRARSWRRPGWGFSVGFGRPYYGGYYNSPYYYGW